MITIQDILLEYFHTDGFKWHEHLRNISTTAIKERLKIVEKTLVDLEDAKKELTIAIHEKENE